MQLFEYVLVFCMHPTCTFTPAKAKNAK